MEKRIFINLLRRGEKKNLNGVKCIKDEDQRVLIKEEQIKERWKSYFDKLSHGSYTKDWRELSNPIEDRNRRFV